MKLSNISAIFIFISAVLLFIKNHALIPGVGVYFFNFQTSKISRLIEKPKRVRMERGRGARFGVRLVEVVRDPST